MYILLEVEIKNKVCDSELEYIDENVFEVYETLEEAKEVLNIEIEQTLKRGYFHKIISQSQNGCRVILHNGGSVYKLLSIMKVGA